MLPLRIQEHGKCFFYGRLVWWQQIRDSIRQHSPFTLCLILHQSSKAFICSTTQFPVWAQFMQNVPSAMFWREPHCGVQKQFLFWTVLGRVAKRGCMPVFCSYHLVWRQSTLDLKDATCTSWWGSLQNITLFTPSSCAIGPEFEFLTLHHLPPFNNK